MKFLVLQHINIEHPGIFLKFMKEDNIKIDTVELDENEKIPNLDPYDAMIVMGGPMDTWQEETYPWLKPEKEAIHKFAAINKKPYLGSCRDRNFECLDFIDKKTCDKYKGYTWSTKTCMENIKFPVTYTKYKHYLL